jgi:hypothetical protein
VGLRVTSTCRVGITSALKAIFFARAGVSVTPPAIRSPRPSSSDGTSVDQLGDGA